MRWSAARVVVEGWAPLGLGAPVSRVCRFDHVWGDERLASARSTTGTRANLASFLLAARGLESHPVFRVAPFERAYRLTGWPPAREADPADRYDGAVAFLDEFAERCRTRGVSPMRDRLDAQGLLWQVLSGHPPAGWDPAEIEAYQRFLGGSRWTS